MTPRLFVNVEFHDASKITSFVAGKPLKTNRIVANVRHGPSRTRAHYDKLCESIEAAWTEAVGGRAGKQLQEGPAKDQVELEKELRAIFILGSIVAGSEAGFTVPAAGQDAVWIKENASRFVKLAEQGDQHMGDMVDELSKRDEFKDAISSARASNGVH